MKGTRANWKLKRLAWAYGCAPHDSFEERAAREALIERIRKIIEEGTEETAP